MLHNILFSVWLCFYEVKVAQSYPTLCNPMDYTLHRILQARILEWVAFPFSRGSSQPRDGTQVSCFAWRYFTNWATRDIKFVFIEASKWVKWYLTVFWICISKLNGEGNCQHSPVFLLGELHGHRCLVRYSHRVNRVRHNRATNAMNNDVENF